jgi:hypothetical protein
MLTPRSLGESSTHVYVEPKDTMSIFLISRPYIRFHCSCALDFTSEFSCMQPYKSLTWPMELNVEELYATPGSYQRCIFSLIIIISLDGLRHLAPEDAKISSS